MNWCQYVCSACSYLSALWTFLKQTNVIIALVLISVVLYVAYYRLCKCKALTLLYTHTEMNDFLVKHTPELRKVYKPTIYLLNGQLQTIFYAIMRNIINSRFGIEYRRETVKLQDGGQITLDWPLFPEIDNNFKETTPIITIHAGLTGGRHDIYVATMMKDAAKRGFKSVLVNHRGCSGTPIIVSEVY